MSKQPESVSNSSGSTITIKRRPLCYPNPEMKLWLAKSAWNWVPHQSQKEWLLNGASVKVAACGRRWGKSEAAAIDVTTEAYLMQESRQMIVSPTYDQSRLIFGQIENFVQNCDHIRKQAKIMRTPYPRMIIGNSLITARTADADGRNLRGHSAHRVIVDEAAYVKECVINEVLAPMLADCDGKMVMISTPFGKNHFYRSYLRGMGKNGYTASFTFPSCANPHISHEYIERQRELISPRQFEVEYEAKFIDDRNCVFPWDEISACIGSPTTIPEQREMTAAGIDWARYSDYSAVVIMTIGDNGPEVVGIDRFTGINWTEQIDRIMDILSKHRVDTVLTDQTSIGDPLLEQLKQRVWESRMDTAVEGYTFTNQSKRDLIERLAISFARHTITIPSDERLIKELQYFEYELTDSGNIRMNAHTGCNDDLVIALALALKACHGLASGFRVLAGGNRIAAGEW